MRQITYTQALREAMTEEMLRDSTVVYTGLDIKPSGSGMLNIQEPFGPERVVEMPINENLIAYSAIGMALAGLRPVSELMFADFITLTSDALINEAAKQRFWSQGRVQCPMVMLGVGGVGSGGLGSTHAQCPEAWVLNVPGLKVVAPSLPGDAKALLKASIRDNDPVVFLGNRSFMYIPVDAPEIEDEVDIPLGKALIAREGTDVTIVCWHRSFMWAMQLADELQHEGISIEIIDPRTLQPLDMETIIASVQKTGRLVVSHEAPYKYGPGGEIVTQVTERAFSSLKSPPVRACTPMAPIPSFMLEQEFAITKQQVKDAIYEAMGKK